MRSPRREESDGDAKLAIPTASDGEILAPRAAPRRRLICLVYPASCDEPALMESNGSVQIIAAEQFLLIRQYAKAYDVLLYKEDLEPRDSDIMLILTCVPLAPLSVLQKFKKIVYFFDDLTVPKCSDHRYVEKIKHISAIFHPVANIARDLHQALGIPTFYVPWSLARIPEGIAERSPEVSFYLDLDDRNAFYARSVALAIRFVRSLDGFAKTIYVPEKYGPAFPEDARRDIVFTPFMAHDDFLKFLGKVWFYASGIPGSYEFAALEASFMGCGLISMNASLRRAHAGGSCFLDIDFQTDPRDALRRLVESFDRRVVIREAQSRYPRAYAGRIPDLLERLFASAGGSSGA